ncbi:hypothetical protein [Curtobacterium sp. MCBA15_004]|uniref:hypothetical protein n=1 Tax=Curtobacterium sp. MCBA15_004 TaxID=1898733 RepID=UPI001114A6C7|nr:hypothetical protein [Curtobacterium sp. MCBA15_004]WIA96401.1 hypothetical protein QOL16_15085 [Curtobacterium sp. MCBA15_004]
MTNSPGVGLMHWLLASTVSTPDTTPDGFWSWVSGTLSVSDIIQGSGLALIVALFATRRILTIADHRARIEDLQTYHAAVLREKDDRYAAMTASRDEWKQTAAEERDAREKAEEGYREFAVEVGGLTTHLLGSIDAAAETTP